MDRLEGRALYAIQSWVIGVVFIVALMVGYFASWWGALGMLGAFVLGGFHTRVMFAYKKRGGEAGGLAR